MLLMKQHVACSLSVTRLKGRVTRNNLLFWGFHRQVLLQVLFCSRVSFCLQTLTSSSVPLRA